MDAFRKAPRSYQHIDPGLVGNRSRVLASELSGKANVEVKAAEMGVSLSGEKARRAVRAVKELERKGFQFEGTEGSFELLLRRARPDYEHPFELLDFLVLVEKRVDKEILASDGEHSWAMVGSSPNIIEASWQALADSLEYPLIRGWI